MYIHTDILVIGAGPIGLSFARQFKNSSLRVTVLEKSPLNAIQFPSFDGREVAITHTTKAILKKLGIWDLIPAQEIYSLKDACVINGNSDYKLCFEQPTHARGEPIEQLGFLVSNYLIRLACYQSVENLPNIHLLTGKTVEKLQVDQNGVAVTLTDGTHLQAKLLVASDGRFSSIRQKAGIPCDQHQFGRSVICFRMRHELTNQHRACECFYYGHTLAILPLEETLSSMVVTIDTDRIHEILEQSAEDLAQAIFLQTKGKLGHLQMASDKYTYPLVGIHAKRFYANRIALIGDAAVGMHPVTAHGFNLGILSVANLSSLVLEAAERGRDIGDETLLQRYNLKQQAKTRPLYYGTHFLVKLYTNETFFARLLRHTLLHAGNRLEPFKKLVTHQLTG
ncbi:MAG: 5-demethoxyubiquinol-8 5-hydroxylase UbiM [Neisseriaceae bacterium]